MRLTFILGITCSLLILGLCYFFVLISLFLLYIVYSYIYIHTYMMMNYIRSNIMYALHADYGERVVWGA